AHRKPAQAAESASRSVRPARYSKKAKPCPKCPSVTTSCHTLSACGTRENTMSETSKKRLATVWLDGCSGCHMSFLDTDERLLELAAAIELVYSPLVDRKDFPEQVDVTLVEGSVSSEEDF